MGISFSIPCDPCINNLSQWLDEKVACIHNLEKNLTSLETTMKELKAERDDLSSLVTREEDRGQQRLAKIQVWLDNVETIEKRVKDLFSARNVELQRRCLCGFCSKGLISSYRYGKRVFLTLRDVEELKCNGAFEDVAKPPQTSVVEERPLPRTIVGQETMLDKAWKHLTEDGVGIMGFYGMGGVGKTTLLTQLNNRFRDDRCEFDFVIWVVVSKELQVEKIRDKIAQKVGVFGGEEWNQKDENEKGIYLYNFLMKKRFVLFLDDIWQKVDLAEIGIPFPSPTTQNRSKVVFTTRSQDVCAHMGVEHPMEVKCLADNEAFDLFEKKVGQVTLGSNPEIPDLARIVARKCRGLPLALNVIGETMSCKRMVEEWHHAIDVLTSYAAQFSGMEDEILPILKYSYDNLKGEQVRSCFLYCALFPEDDRILKEKLIGYWIGEGIIDGSESVKRAENKGYEIIGSLVRASLLMEDGTDKVCMHDVVREMALWIASDLGQEKEAFIVHAGVGLRKIPKVKNWNVVRRMSMMKNRIRDLPGSPECLQLTTLLLQDAFLQRISREFFKSMPKLLVLDLSQNLNLHELPDSISELVSLQYLDLSGTSIRVLPMSLLQELKILIHLRLVATRALSSIAGISNLHNLKVLNLRSSGLSLDPRTVEELETLEHLEILGIGISTRSMKPFFSSQRLMSCTRSLMINESGMESLMINESGMESSLTTDWDLESCVNLRYLSIVSFNISEIKMEGICNKSKTVSPLHNPSIPCFSSLCVVEIRSCLRLRDLTFLMFTSNLKKLYVSFSNELEEVINKERASEGEESGIVPFPKLIYLHLESLPQLKNIHWRPLPFPCLKEIRVKGCPNLKKLPLDSKSGTHGENGLFITYDSPRWIKGVEWEDEATKTRFLSSCKQI